MATSGTYEFDPKLEEILTESYERAGVDAAAIGAPLIEAAFRSMRMMLNSEWSTFGYRQWTIQRGTQLTTVGMTNFCLPEGAIDIVAAVLRRNDKDTEMYGISRNEYLTIVNKPLTGRPDRYYVDRQAGRLGRLAYIWRAGTNTTDTIVFDYFRQIQDAVNAESDLAQGLQLPAHAFDAMCAGLAMRLAEKFNAERYDRLRVAYGGVTYPHSIGGGALERMRQEDRERGDIELYGVFEPRTGRR